MSFRSSPARVRNSVFQIIGRLLLVVAIAGGIVLLARLMTGDQASAAPDIQNQSTDQLWSFIAETDSQAALRIASAYRSYRKVRLNTDSFTAALAKAQLESATKSKAAQLIITLPQAEGTFMRFAIVESPIMAPELAARYPEIKTYSAQGIDDPAATARFDWTPTGFHAIVLATSGTSLVEPETQGDRANYLVYSPGDVVVESAECDVSAADQEAAAKRDMLLKKSGVRENVSSGSTLRTYRLAAAATAEYTQTYGFGSVVQGLAAVTTTVNLVDAIYEREVAVRLVLVANNDAIIFTNSTTDGYTSDNVNLLIGENQTKLDSVIGSANYDIGHVFDGRTQSGGGFSWRAWDRSE